MDDNIIPKVHHYTDVDKRYYENNKERISARRKELRNKEKESARVSEWKKNNKEKVRARRVIDSAIRRARKGSGGKYTQKEWSLLIEKYGYSCLCCGEKKPLTPDHIIPLSKGGTNTIDNIQPLCGTCNNRKFTKTIDFRGKVIDS